MTFCGRSRFEGQDLACHRLDFSRAVSEAIAKTNPRTYTTTFPKAERERQNPDRLTEEQPNEYLGLCRLATGPARRESVDASQLGRF